MRFALGVLVGVFIGRPVLDLVNRHMTSPMSHAVADGLSYAAHGMRKIADNLDARVEDYHNEQGE